MLNVECSLEKEPARQADGGTSENFSGGGSGGGSKAGNLARRPLFSLRMLWYSAVRRVHFNSSSTLARTGVSRRRQSTARTKASSSPCRFTGHFTPPRILQSGHQATQER